MMTGRLFLVLAFLRSATIAVELENIAISGWFPECNFDGGALKDSCAGTFRELNTEQPVTLDPTGETCYVNPLTTSDITSSRGVFWFGNERMYSTLLLGENVTMYSPTNCTSSGACECGPFEEWRGDDWELGNCTMSCSFVPSIGLANLVGEDCATFFRASTLYEGEPVGTCPILGRIIDVTPPTPAPVTSGGLLLLSGHKVACLMVVSLAVASVWF